MIDGDSPSLVGGRPVVTCPHCMTQMSLDSLDVGHLEMRDYSVVCAECFGGFRFTVKITVVQGQE